MISLLGAVALWGVAAVADEPPRPGHAFDATGDALSAELRALAPDTERLRGLLDELTRQAAVLDGPVDADAWVRLLLDMTVVRYQLGQPWRAPREAAYRVRPDLPVPVGPSLRELRDWVPEDPSGHEELPFGRRAWLDGRELGALPTLSGLHLLQGVRCDVWQSQLVEADAAAQERQRWFAPCAPRAWRSGDVALVVSGGSVALAGVIAAAVSFGLAQRLGGGEGVQPTAEVSPAQRRGLRGVNAAGWASVGVGVAVIIPGVTRRVQQVRRDRVRP